MKKKFILFILFIFISLNMYGEKIYLKNGTVIIGTITNMKNNVFTVKEKNKIINIKKNDIVKIEISREVFDYNFIMSKDYKDWKIGGRRENGSLIYIDKIDNSEWLRIHKDGYTENNLYKDFELPYMNNTNIYFSSEMMGFTSKSLKLSEKKYAISGIIFIFLDKNKDEINRVAYAWGTDAYPFEKHSWIKRLYASIYNPFEISFNIRDFAKDKNVKYLRVLFWTYCSSNDKELSADLWVKNVKIILKYNTK